MKTCWGISALMGLKPASRGNLLYGIPTLERLYFITWCLFSIESKIGDHLIFGKYDQGKTQTNNKALIFSSIWFIV